MKTLTEFPRAVREHHHVWIPMADGTRLAARLWIPEGAHRDPVPAILEYIPYPKDAETAHRDAIAYRYYAGHGYAGVRVDVRGGGDSEGVLTDEYLPSELDDGCAVLRWIADQPWCNGKVGMIGISWGGFNGLQIAAMRPPELAAVITLCSTDDRYADDIHHMGGCLLNDNLSWASVMFAYNSCPPDPAIVGAAWRRMWQDRLEGSGLWLETWLRHQRRDDYWKHGSICEAYGAIECPVFAVSGWADGYSNAVFRLLQHLKVPTRGLIGPWSHAYPHFGVPGPAIGFLQEARRFWDHWLKGIDTGIEAEPRLRVWMQDSVPPSTSYTERPGRWVAEPSWPSDNCQPHSYALTRRGLDDGNVGDEPQTIRSPLDVGLFAGRWCSYPSRSDLPHDQRADDGGSLVFDGPPLTERTEILGAPRLELEVSADRPVAMLAARLSDIGLDHRVARVTYGLLNLCHRESSEEPTPLEPGRRYQVQLRLNEIAYAFPPGHRLRVALSTCYWPLAWPPPEPVTLTIHRGRLLLPVRPPRAEDDDLRPFEPPAGAPGTARQQLEPPEFRWRVSHDLPAGVSALEMVEDDGRFRAETGLEVRRYGVERYTTFEDDYQSPCAETRLTRTFSREDWEIRTETHTVLTANEHVFYLTAELRAWEGKQQVHEQTWDVTIDRDLL